MSGTAVVCCFYWLSGLSPDLHLPLLGRRDVMTFAKCDTKGCSSALCLRWTLTCMIRMSRHS